MVALVPVQAQVCPLEENNYAIGGLHMMSSKHDYANYDQFAPNSDIAHKTAQRVSVPNLNLFGPMKTELQAKEVR